MRGRRVSPGPRGNGKRTPGQTPTVHRLGSDRGEDDHGGDPGGWAVGPATLAPHAVTQVRVIVPTPRACGTVMLDGGPGPLGLCPVRGIVEVEQASNIWLANPGSQPI